MITIASSYQVHDLMANIPGDEVFFKVGKDEVRLVPHEAETDAGHTPIHVAVLSTTGNSTIVGMLRAIRDRRVPPGTDLTHEALVTAEAEGPLTDDEGELRGGVTIPPGAYPEPLREFLRDRRRRHHEAAYRVISVYRWSTLRPGGHRGMLGLGQHEWSEDGGVTWTPLPLAPQPWMDVLGVDELSPSRVAGVQALLDAGVTEPVGHGLFREAWEQHHHNPRSALVLAVAALEIGVKQQIAHFVPGARWLVDEVPSPPVIKMLTDYVPTLAADRWLAVPQDDLTTLRNAVTARNMLSHRGTPPPSLDSLWKILMAIRSVLYTLDYQRGHHWARGWIGWSGTTPTTAQPVFRIEMPQYE